MQPIQQSSTDATESTISFVSVDAADLQLRLTGSLALSAKIVRPDQTVVTGTGTFSEADPVLLPGVRQYKPSADDLAQVGCNVVVITASGMEPREIPLIVTAGDPYGEVGSRFSISFHGLARGEVSPAKAVIPFTAVDTADLTNRLDAGTLTWTARVLKSSGVIETGTGTVVQPSVSQARGVCFYVASPEDLSNVGASVLRLSAPGAEPRELDFYVLPYDPFAPLPSVGYTWQSLIDRARVYIADDHDDNRGFLTPQKWLLLANVEYQSLRRTWLRLGLVRPPIVTTTFAGPSITLVGVEAVVGVAQDSGGTRVLKYDNTIWPSNRGGLGTTWFATGTGAELTITVDPADTSQYTVKWVQSVPYAVDPNAIVDLPAGADERLVLGLAKRALVKDSARSSPLEELIAAQDAQISFSASSQIRPAAKVSPSNRFNYGMSAIDPRQWRYF